MEDKEILKISDDNIPESYTEQAEMVIDSINVRDLDKYLKEKNNGNK